MIDAVDLFFGRRHRKPRARCLLGHLSAPLHLQTTGSFELPVPAMGT